VWGLLGASLAAVAYGAATILQTLGVKRLAALPPGTPRLRRLRAGDLYAAGVALDLGGFLASVAALRTLPLFLVESAVASSVAVTAVLAVVVLHVRLQRREIVSLGVALLGLVLMAVGARSGPADHLGNAGGWAVLAAGAVVVALLVGGARDRSDRRAATVLAVASGLGFGLLGFAARSLVVRTPWWHTAADPLLWSVLVEGIVGSVAYGLALHRGRTTTVAAITFVTETVIPAILGLVFLGDGVRPGFAPVVVVGFVAAVTGSVALAGRAEPAEAILA
jgi:drug/metabolite transporter (DMT)-like permease